MSVVGEKISVVIPVYNCENYLEQCIESVVTQSYSNLEIILVDDGSTDNSGHICKAWSKKDSRIIVITQKNQGQNRARYRGVKESTGKYIAFVDGDDWIDSEMYSNLIKDIGDNELISSGTIRHDENIDNFYEWFDLLNEGEYKTDDPVFLNNLIIAQNYTGGVNIGGISNNLWNKLFLAKKLKEVFEKYDVYVRYEEDFLVILFYIVKSIYVKFTSG